MKIIEIVCKLETHAARWLLGRRRQGCAPRLPVPQPWLPSSEGSMKRIEVILRFGLTQTLRMARGNAWYPDPDLERVASSLNNIAAGLSPIGFRLVEELWKL